MFDAYSVGICDSINIGFLSRSLTPPYAILFVAFSDIKQNLSLDFDVKLFANRKRADFAR